MQLNLTQWIGVLVGLALLIQGARAGYRRGPLRQLAGVLALIVAGVVGWLAGPTIGLALLADTWFPWMLREGAGILMMGLVVWLVALAWLWHLGRRPKGAEEAESPVLGAMVGCWTGLLDGALILLLVTGWAGLAETALRPEESAHSWAVETREALARLPGASALSGYSPWPESWARLLGKCRATFGNPEASRHLMEQERIRALAAHPSFYTAWGDPEIKMLLRQGRFLEAARHPKAHTVMNDEEFQRDLLKLNLENAVDEALAKTRSR